VAPLLKLRIVLLGWILSGRSATANTIFNNKCDVEKSQTGTYYSGDVNGRKITVLDTPSWWKYFTSKFNPKFSQATTTLESMRKSQHMRFPHALILTIPIDTSFKDEQKRIIKDRMAILGEDVWRHTIVLFTWGDRFPDISIEQRIESEGEALQWLIQKCRNRYHVFDNTDKSPAQVTELLQKIDEMAAQNILFSLENQSAVHVSDTQHDEEEISLNTDQFLKLMYQEMKNRRKKIIMKIEELGMDFRGDIADDRSIGERPNCKQAILSNSHIIPYYLIFHIPHYSKEMTTINVIFEHFSVSSSSSSVG